MTSATGHDELDVLEQLEAASRRREQELHELADQVPAAVSRTALVRAMLGGLGDLLPSRRRRP